MKNLLSMLLVLTCFGSSSHSQELSETDKLFATCKVWGYLKYFHPKVAAGKFDLDQELFEILSKIEKPSSKVEFSRILIDWINSFGKIKSNPKSPNENFDFMETWFDKPNLNEIDNGIVITDDESRAVNKVPKTELLRLKTGLKLNTKVYKCNNNRKNDCLASGKAGSLCL